MKALLSFSPSKFETWCFQARVKLTPPHRVPGCCRGVVAGASSSRKPGFKLKGLLYTFQDRTLKPGCFQARVELAPPPPWDAVAIAPPTVWSIHHGAGGGARGCKKYKVRIERSTTAIYPSLHDYIFRVNKLLKSGRGAFKVLIQGLEVYVGSVGHGV